MDILNTFGLNPYLLLAQIINFLVILYVLKRFLYPPLFKVFKKREDLIKETIEKSNQSEKILEKTRLEEKEIIKNARIAAEEIIRDAKEQSADVVKQTEVSTKKQTEKMIAEAKTHIELESAQAQEQLNKYIVQLSIDVLKRSLGDVFSEKEQSEIIEKALKEIKNRPS